MIDNGACSYRRFLEGDDEGIIELIRDYKDGMILYINSIVGNIFVAEEITEETFMRIVTKKPHFNHSVTFKTWLYTIGKNIAIDHLRRSSKISGRPFEDYDAKIKAEEDLERSYIATEQKIMLHRVLAKLNPKYRQVLYLSFFEGFTNEQIAKVMNKSKRQIEQLLYQAKLSLKQELIRDGFVYEEL